MTTFRCMALASLGSAFAGLAFCIGCGDSSTKPWEGGKSQSSSRKASQEKASPKADDTVDNDQADTTGESNNTPSTISPHGAVNPHGEMPMPAGAADEVLENNGKLDLDAVHWTVPKSWVRKAPKMPRIIQAEYGIPKAEGDKEDGRLTVSEARGSVEDNIARWKKQFGEKPDKESESTLEAGGVKIKLVDLTGTYNESRGPMMMGPTVPHPDYRMLGAIFQLPNEDGLHFIKCYGPRKTITARADEIKGFLTSLKVDK